ncbi:MAG: hypothetical protein A3B07_02940 [Candidatus Yonathbacteria bacterium RIFCSPLOWO2_01_FULL_43_27]|uniref:Uncharacterized protein n=2 Tax=Parcubacteria group TaxID=1794811 RepID=A0A1G2SCM9_9BACT|nr:MAG: hypothetical protein UW78_C0008G0021 [Candidatus Azambacteria bacterium GW2011_GWA1_44_9]OHA82548.1 MAG: hypothetical protein A3B07_02940 [Candidatus Yonathbacteria bacterium RIFCSPLOWO2_01_FULL_43_27]
MLQNYKKILVLIFSVVVGGGIIFFTWQRVSVNPNKNLADSEKTNSFTQGDWRDALKVIPGDSLYPLLLGARSNINGSSTLATTTTDRLGRELLVSYALAQKTIGNKTMSESDTKTLSGILADKAMVDTTVKQYTKKDLKIVPSSSSALATYQKELSKLLADFSAKNTLNEVKVVAEAVEKNDNSKLVSLTKTASSLQKLLDSLLAVKTPETVTSFHLFLLQNYTLIYSGVVDMQQIVNDPVTGMRGIAKYRQGMNALNMFVDNIKAAQ